MEDSHGRGANERPAAHSSRSENSLIFFCLCLRCEDFTQSPYFCLANDFVLHASFNEGKCCGKIIAYSTFILVCLSVSSQVVELISLCVKAVAEHCMINSCCSASTREKGSLTIKLRVV